MTRRFHPLIAWPEQLPRPVIKPFIQEDGKRYSGREEYNWYLIEQDVLSQITHHSEYSLHRLNQLSYLLPLIDHLASQMELKEFILNQTRHFPVREVA